MNTVSNPQVLGKGTATAGHAPDTNDVTIACHENSLPSFAGAEIDRLHGHLYCTLSYLQMTGQLDGASTFVASRDGVPISILLFSREGNAVNVISEFARLHEEDIGRFADYVFSAYRDVRRITFNRVWPAYGRLRYPSHAIACTEDMVVMLPATVAEYEARIGKNMRRNMKRYANAIVRDFPSYCYQVYERQDVSEQDIRDIIRLSCDRMESKNISPRFTETETRWIVAYAKQCGLVGIARIDGRVCAGAIGFRIGENYFMHVIAHDLAYNDYSLGILCYYRTLCEGIARGGKRFHLLQGRYGYKYRLLAEHNAIHHLDVYRSRTAALLNGKRIARKEIDGRILALKQWLLHDVERSDDPKLRRLASAINTLRRWKRARGAAPKGEAGM